jgi:Ca2+-binding RTX toxin-like protein
MAEIIGTNGDDKIGGWMADLSTTDDGDIIHGLDGDDYIWAGAGNDLIYGGDHSDRIYGNDGDDFLSGGRGADTLDGDSSFGADGIDTAMYAESGAGVLVSLASGDGSGGSAEGDVLVGIENISGSSYDDTLIGDGENNELSGGGGDDVLEGGGGVDTLNGEADNDILKGGGGADTLNGGGGADTLKGGGGADTLNGGNGNDTASYDDSADGVWVLLYTDEAAGGDAEGDELNNIENVTGSDHADVLWGDDGANVLRGMDGSDMLKGWGGADTLDAGSGDDLLAGGGGGDTLNGGNGNDTAEYTDSPSGVSLWLSGGQAGDGGYAQGDTLTSIENLTGSAHGDFLNGNDGNNLLRGLDGNDTLWGYGGADTLNAGGGSDWLLGGNGSDTLRGENGNDYLDGGSGADTLVGGSGNDGYGVDSAGDEITEAGGQGTDEVYTSVSWTLTPGADVEILRTTSDAGVGAINLTGNASGNVVRGNNGANVLNGGNGNDELTGLAGADSFLFNTALNAATNVDVITDFSVADDTIRLDDDIFSSGLTPNNSVAGSQFVIAAEALEASHRIIYNDETGAVLYDSDGAGGADAIQFAWLSAGLALTNFDFLVVA